MVEHYLSVFMHLFSVVVALLAGSSLSGDTAAEMTPHPAEPRVTAVRRHDVALPGGVRLHYLEQGPPSGPAVLMLHGYTDSSFSFSRVLPLLPASLRVIVPDQRGHGRSDRPSAGYAVDDFATDALQLLDALEVPTAIVVGHSMGSFVARRLAEKAPARVTKLVLAGSAPRASNAGLNELQEAVNALTDPIDAAFARGFQESTVLKPVPSAFMDQAIAESLTVPARVWKAALTGLIAYAPTGAPSCPTLVVGGDADTVFSLAEQQALASSISGASMDIVAGIGHTLHWEDPARFVEAVSKFMDGR